MQAVSMKKGWLLIKEAKRIDQDDADSSLYPLLSKDKKSKKNTKSGA